MSERRKYSAFLSFADPDRPLAGALHSLFKKLGEDTYFAPKDLPKAGTSKWREAILDGIRASHCFVPIYTRHSLDRRWVLYESGAAGYAGFEVYPALVSGVSYKDLYDVPGPDTQVFDISEREGLTQLAIKVCQSRTGDSWESLERKVRPTITQSRYAVRILSYARARSVFIAGNVPRGDFWKTTGMTCYNTRKGYATRLKKFVDKLTVGLLQAGFNLVSCPTVGPVGGIVEREATGWLVENSTVGDWSRFQIDGMYPIDRDTRESGAPGKILEHLRLHLMEYRKRYLRNQEWLIVIGGSEGTTEEYEAARELGTVRTFAVPCFGGAAGRICRKRDVGIKGPCVKCAVRNGKCDPAEIADYLLRKGTG